MSLYQLAAGIEEDATRIRDRNRLVRDVQEYAYLQEELTELTAKIHGVTQSITVLLEAGINVTVVRPSDTAIASLHALTPDGAALVDAPAAAAKPTIQDLKTWARDSDQEAKQAYRAWADSVLVDLEGAASFGRQLRRLDPAGGVKIERLVAEGNARLRTLPTSATEVGELVALAKELEEATQAFAPAEETKEFVRAVLEGGAPLDLLTDDVRAWATERGLWSSLRVRLSGDSDD